MTPPVRVLVVDDSALMRKLIPQILRSNDSIEVVGTAIDGEFALKKIEELNPQVVTLDLEMPGIGGLETLRRIRARHGTPVIVVSAYCQEGTAQTLQALSLGAFDFVTKPTDVTERMPNIAGELIAKIKAAACSRDLQPLPAPPPRSAKLFPNPNLTPTRIVGLGVSTGGPQALQSLLPQLPANFPGAIVIVQHMPASFTEQFAQRMDEISSIRVREAKSGEVLRAGCALVCPGNRHLRVVRMFQDDIVILGDEPPVNGHRPSVDVMFHSLAQAGGGRSIAVLMTGMGDDGARALGEVKAAGGLTIAQSEESCVVFGMPKAAIERGHASRVVALDALAAVLLAECTGDPKAENAAEPRLSRAAGNGEN